jgi:hypothetical protein
MHSLKKRVQRLEQRLQVKPNVHFVWVGPNRSKEDALAGRNIPEGDIIHFIGYLAQHDSSAELFNESY